MEDSGSSPSGVTGEPVDISGLSFTATYSDGTTGSVVPSSYTPTSFGDTAGTQTVTFSFAGTDITVDVDYDVEAAGLMVTGISVSGTQANCNVQGSRFRPKGLVFTIATSDGQTITTGSQNTEDVDYNWNRADARADASCSITIDEITGDPSSIVTYNPSSSYFFGVGQVALTIRPNEDCLEALGLDGYTIADSAYTTLNLDVINCYHLVGSIDDSLQIEGQAPDLTGATLYAYGSGDDKDPQTGLPTGNGTQINDPEFDPTVYSTTGTQTLSIRSSNTSTWGPVPMTTTVDVQPGTPVSTPTVTSISISGTGDMSAQTADDWVVYTGLTFTYGLSDGTTVVKQGDAGVYDEGFEVAYESGADLVDGKWVNPLPSSSTLTVTVDDGSGSWWANHGYQVASPAPSTTVTFS